jgi:hypothetical protein
LNHGEFAASLHEPGDYREKLDDRPYMPGGQVVQCGEDPVVRIIFDIPIAPWANYFLATRSEVLPA